jgi:hypothetical protein
MLSNNCKGADIVNSAKRRQLKQAARREARLNLTVEVFGWSVVILGAAVMAKVMYVALVYIMLF